MDAQYILVVCIFLIALTFYEYYKFLDGPSTEKDSEEKKKESAVTSQNSPEAREERYFTLRKFFSIES